MLSEEGGICPAARSGEAAHRNTSVLRQTEKRFMYAYERDATVNRDNARNRCRSVRVHRNLQSAHLKETVAVFAFDGDFLFIPSPLKERARTGIVDMVVKRLLYHPYRNSIDRFYDTGALNFYAEHARDPQQVLEVPGRAGPGLRGDPLSLAKKIRWSSLGYYYNWERKEYDFAINNPMPDALAGAAKEIAALFCDAPAFTPETAIVNYYQRKDRMMGHVDRYEKDMTKPLVSLSFGCSCVFVVGGADVNDRAEGFLVEDGDVVVLNKRSRLFYHGVPKILPDSLGAYGDDVRPFVSESRINVSIRQIN